MHLNCRWACEVRTSDVKLRADSTPEKLHNILCRLVILTHFHSFVNIMYTCKVIRRHRKSDTTVCGIKSYRLRAQVRIRAQLIIRKGAETGGATSVGKICTVRSVKRQRSANCCLLTRFLT